MFALYQRHPLQLLFFQLRKSSNCVLQVCFSFLELGWLEICCYFLIENEAFFATGNKRWIIDRIRHFW